MNEVLTETREDNDNVNHPGHYAFGGIEVIDYIRDKMTPEEFQGYCMGNVEDLKKAEVYLKWMIESEKKHEQK